MKTLAKSLLAALLIGTATFANAETIVKAENTVKSVVATPTYKVAIFPSVTPSKLNVFVERAPGKSMTVSLKSNNGYVLGQQVVNKKEGNFRFQFDLSELKDGSYTVEVISGSDVTVHPITLETQPEQTVSRTITLE